jgi:predicted nuclease of predicted toxin-antitoxin system
LRWLADECVHSEVVEELRAAGHDVTYAAEFARQTPDPVLLKTALAENRIFLTEDKGIGELIFEQESGSFGVVLLRFASADRGLKWPRLRDAIAQYGEELYRRYTVLTKGRARSQLLVAEKPE